MKQFIIFVTSLKTSNYFNTLEVRFQIISEYYAGIACHSLD
jgi:hypothetical protein